MPPLAVSLVPLYLLGLKKMQSRLKSVDCVIEVHDARIPFSGRNPLFQELLDLKPHLLVLNKMDLADLTRDCVYEVHGQDTESLVTSWIQVFLPFL